MNVAVVTGICVERDAISAAAVDRALALTEMAGVDDVTLIAQHHDRACDVRTVTVDGSWSLARSAAIAGADLVVFHWGIWYDSFNALPLIAPERRTVVQFHNVTPAELVPADQRAVIDASIRQIQLPAMTGTALWADSEHNRHTLGEWGYDVGAVRVMPLVVERPARARPRIGSVDTVRLLSVGRLVHAKGVDILVDAMSSVVDRLDGRVSAVFVGNADLSHSGYLDEVRRTIRERKLGRFVRIKQDLDDRGLAREYARAHVLVSPSLHEGLCLPVIEAYRAGLRVVGTDAGNLPYVVQAPDPVVPAGDPAALAEAIVDVATEVLEGRSDAPPGAAALIQKHSAGHVRAALAEAIGSLGIV